MKRFVLLGCIGLFVSCGSAVDSDPVEELRTQELGKECSVVGVCIEGYQWDFDLCRCMRDVPDNRQECNVVGVCAAGFHWDDTPCACLPDAADRTTVACGDNACGSGEFCCNASCGICMPEGEGCVQLVCLP